METLPTVNDMAGLHRVKRKQKDGSIREHLYAWRGGPRVGGQTPEEIKASFERERGKYNPDWKTPRAPRLPQPSDPATALRRACNRAFDNAKARAAKRGIDFTLNGEAIHRLAETQKWRCAVSGLLFDISYDAGGKHTYNPYGISIDRIDCSRGYTPRNIRLILTAVNFGLNDWGEAIYLRIAKAVVARDLLKDAS